MHVQIRREGNFAIARTSAALTKWRVARKRDYLAPVLMVTAGDQRHAAFGELDVDLVDAHALLAASFASFLLYFIRPPQVDARRVYT